MFVSNRICQLWLAAILVANCLAQFSSVKTKNLSIRNQKSDEGIPFADEMFRIVRSGPSNVGDNVDFSFQLPSGKSLQNPNCTFITPSGKNISSTPQQNNETEVFDDAGQFIENFTAHPSGPHNDLCGLSINGIVPEDFGEWHCIINDGEAVHHIGALTILTKAEIFVKDVRLPRHIQPVNYGVDLFPVIEVGNFTTNGILRFKFQRVADDEWLQKDPNLYKKVFLTAKDIAIDENTVLVKKADDGQTFSIVAHEYDFERDFYIIHLNKELPTGTDLLVEMKFKSYLNDYLSGFYRSHYFDEEAGEFKHLAVTQFESHFARWAFPCLDEPDRKATFTISLKHKANMTALSNMDEDRVVNDEDGYKITYFKESVKMSTYLVAFLVSDFSFTELTPNYKIWHQAAKKGQAQISAENGPKILEFYEDFFNITYPLPKTDMAAIPDFSFGAMENWGLITYRETLLLFVDGISDAGNKESILTVMAHELAHQWFGNLVTMKWWTDLWLNEGFATYTEYHGVDHVFKEARVRDRMVLQEVQFVFGVDALESTTALSQPVFNPTYDILIGSIAYSKGGSILRMVENFLTLETFKKGVTQYLTKNAYQNAERDDLWSALTEAAEADNRLPEGITIKDIMDSWTSEPGFPVVKVEKNDGKSITLSQKRFYLNAEVAQPSTVKWTIPINVAYPEAKDSGFATTTPQEWMLESELTLNITESPFVINIQETGYYRVNYDDKNWQALTNVLKKDHSLIHELNRAQILDDGLQLARAKQLDYETALGLTEYLEKETEYIPWESAINGLRYLDLLLNDNSSLTEYGYFKAYLTKLLTPVYTKLGFEGSDSDLHLTILQRQSVLTTLCRMGHPDCVSKSVKLFKQWVDKPTVNPISANLRDVVYETAIRNGGEAEWEFLWKQFLKEQVDSEKQKILYGLGATTDENSIHKYLTETLGENIRLQDVINVYRAIGSFAPGRRFQFEWLQENWDTIKEYMKSKFSDFMVNLVSGYGAAANTESEIKILEDFLENRRPDLGLSTGDIESIIETARINLKWMNENKQTVSDWLKSRVPVPTTTPTPVTTTTSSASRLSYALTIVFGMLLCVKYLL